MWAKAWSSKGVPSYPEVPSPIALGTPFPCSNWPLSHRCDKSCQDRPANLHPKGPSSCWPLSCRPHSLPASGSVLSGPSGARNMTATPPAPLQPRLWADVLWYFLVPLKEQCILNPESSSAQPWPVSHGVSMSSLGTASLSPAHFHHQAGLFCQLQSYMSCLLPPGTLCACDISTLGPRPIYHSLRLVQARLERSGQGLPMCYTLCLRCVPHPPAALIGTRCLFDLPHALLSARKAFPRKDLINSFSLRCKCLVMSMALFSQA